MQKIFILCFCLVFVSSCGFGQNVATGKIMDQRTNEPIESAIVSAEKMGKWLLQMPGGISKSNCLETAVFSTFQ